MKMENFGQEFVKIETRSLCAVYLLVCEGKVVYVGQSRNVYARVSRHWQNYQRIVTGKEPYDRDTIAAIRFDTAMVKFCAKEQLNDLEYDLIQRFMPKHNRQLRRSLASIEMLPGVQEWLRSRSFKRANVGIRKRSITKISRFAA